eukprot:UN29610
MSQAKQILKDNFHQDSRFCEYLDEYECHYDYDDIYKYNNKHIEYSYNNEPILELSDNDNCECSKQEWNYQIEPIYTLDNENKHQHTTQTIHNKNSYDINPNSRNSQYHTSIENLQTELEENYFSRIHHVIQL